MIRNNITEVAYTVQTTVDAKNNIPIDYKVTNQNDSKAIRVILTPVRGEKYSEPTGHGTRNITG
jgi:hypothetical protein